MPVFTIGLICSLLLSLILSPLARATARRLGILDHPDNHLKNHRKPMPYLGGVAVFFSFTICAIALGRTGHIQLNHLMILIVGGTLITLWGLVDDILRLPYYAKLPGQIAVALTVAIGGITLNIYFLPPELNFALTILWIVGIINAVNMVDVMDGLAGGVCCISCLGFLATSLITANPSVGILSACLCGALLGFLRFNIPPASIFLGEAGTGFIGFVLASLAVWQNYTIVNDLALLNPLLLLGIPIFDTFLVILTRIRRRRSIFIGSRDHFAIRLAALGFKHHTIILLSYGVATILCAFSLIILTAPPAVAIASYSIVIAMAAVFTFILATSPVAEQAGTSTTKNERNPVALEPPA